MKLQKVDGFDNFAKDVESGVVLNINTNEINQAKKRKQAKLARKEKEKALENDVLSLKKDMSEIKELLKKIVEE